MKEQISFVKTVITVTLFFFAGLAFAESKTLIEMKGDKPEAGLAKSWKKVGEGSYEFVLDTSAKIKDKPLTPDIVKKSLEDKLGSSHSVKVAVKGKDTVVVSYSGSEPEFLSSVSKTRIRGGENVELALDSSVSEGGIRAKTADREPASGEVKGTVLKSSAKAIDILVSKVSKDGVAAKIKEKSKIKIAPPTGLTFKKNDPIFFVPEKEENGMWKTAKVTKE